MTDLQIYRPGKDHFALFTSIYQSDEACNDHDTNERPHVKGHMQKCELFTKWPWKELLENNLGKMCTL